MGAGHPLYGIALRKPLWPAALARPVGCAIMAYKMEQVTIIGRGSAPGKVILFGEHAVVYGRPALAVPVTQVRAEATVEPGLEGAGPVIYAEDLREEVIVADAPADHPLAAAVRMALAQLGLAEPPSWKVTVHSTIPVASGLGSGAAVSAAIVCALADAAGRALAPPEVSALVFEVEKLHHGTPSGVDNTVIAYGHPVYFARRGGRPPEPAHTVFFPVRIGRPFQLAIANSGIASPTRVAVEDVRRACQREPARFEGLFDGIARVVEAARIAISEGEPERLGPLMDENHALLSEMGVSCPELDGLARAARRAGAAGAKLSGAGRGGNLIALVTEQTAGPVTAALRAAGAVDVIITTVGEKTPPATAIDPVRR